jgi:hypothetical protein
VEVELKARVICVTCGTQAGMWCIECARAYCPLCWNKVAHHEFVDPDDVWVNRKPPHPIMPAEHSTKGLQVHINSKGKVEQGLPQRKINEQFYAKGSLKMNRMSSFPAPNTIADKGFVYAQTWADLDDGNSSVLSANGSVNSGISKNEHRLNVRVDEDMTNFDGDYLSQQGDFEDSLTDDGTEEHGGPHGTGRRSPKSPYVRTATTRRSPEKPPRELSERAKSPETLMWQIATGTDSKGGGLVNVSHFRAEHIN